jgi:hypothetical protein
MTNVEIIEELTDMIERQNKIIKELAVDNGEQAAFIEELLRD